MIRRRLRKLCIFLRNIVLSFFITTTLYFYISHRLNTRNILEDLSTTAHKYIQYKAIKRENYNATEIKRLITKYNLEEFVLNADKFGPIGNETIVFVIRVQAYSDAFKYHLASLSEVIGIQDTLIIFSHLYLDANINNLIESIDFCRVLQIFYPYSLQIYPREFPGFGKNDCPASMKIKDAKFANCVGASTPDIHGRYRHPANAEKKHFWWWTVNKVFDNLTSMQGHKGIVIFLRDDLYILEDFLYMVVYMKNLAKSLPQCEFISMTPDSLRVGDDTYRVELSTWNPKYHSDVLVFDSGLWNKIVGHYDLFCVIDDSSWSRSLLYLSLNRHTYIKFKVIYSTISRVRKISDSTCGSLGSNDVTGKVVEALTIQKHIKNNLFPPYLEVYTSIELDDEEYAFFDVIEGDGGWSDPRDISLCNNLTVNKISKLLLDMENQFNF